MELQEALTKMFTTDPVNWIKWGITFAVLIAGYIVCFKPYKKIAYLMSWERKQDIARSKGHIIRAEILKQHSIGEDADDWYATYQYSMNEKIKQYRAYFKNISPPRILYLYYINNPKKVFSVQEYHWDNHKGILLLFILFLPWLLAALTLILLKIDVSGIAT